jgi:hypothetical protein
VTYLRQTREGLVETALKRLAQLDPARRDQITGLWARVRPEDHRRVLMTEVGDVGLRLLCDRADRALRAQRTAERDQVDEI